MVNDGEDWPDKRMEPIGQNGNTGEHYSYKAIGETVAKSLTKFQNRFMEEHIHLKDPTNPAHYRQGNIEVIDFILDQQMNYLEGNVVKYISRYKYKNGLEDLKKAKWYIEKLIEQKESK